MIPIVPQVKKITETGGKFAGEIEFITDINLPSEGYRIVLREGKGEVRFSREAGKFYAQKTLQQIEKNLGYLPNMEIEDEPRFAYRGFMLDCCRHFIPVDRILKHVEIMAELKLNVFHWHLSDDQGWRVQIDAYPLLTERASVRAQTCGDGKEHGGFYTKADIKRVVDFCEERHITVIPEIDMPGHFTAAIHAYPELSCQGKNIPVATHFGVFPNLACAGKDSTYEFIYRVLDELFEMFPAPYMHLGGDEAMKKNYKACPHCQQKIAESGLGGEEELQSYFLNRITEYCNAHGRTVINWNDGMYGGNRTGDILVQYWKETAKGKKAIEGQPTVFSPCLSYYLDYPHGMTPLKKTYNADICAKGADIVGTEAPLWTEHIEDEETEDRQIYPRLVAVADRAWTGEKDYVDFCHRLEYFNRILDEKGIKYTVESNPSKIKGWIQTLKFGIKAFVRSR